MFHPRSTCHGATALGFLIIAGAGLGLPVEARASVIIQSRALACTSTQCVDDGTMGPAHSASASDHGNSASALARVAGTYGDLHAFATAEATYTNGYLRRWNTEGQGWGYAGWNDSITIGGLPEGTPVTLNFAVSLHSLLSSNYPNEIATVGFTTLYAMANLQVLDYANATDWRRDLRLEHSLSDPASGSDWMTLAGTMGVASGDTVWLHGDLTAMAVAIPGYPIGFDGGCPCTPATVMTTTDASNTSQIAFWFDNSAATYISQNGATYLSSLPRPQQAIPEPTSLALLAGGALGVFGARKALQSSPER